MDQSNMPGLDQSNTPWRQFPLTDWILVLTVLLAVTGAVVMFRFLWRKWTAWRIQTFLERRAALASPLESELTTHDKQVLQQKAKESATERLKKSFAFTGNWDLYLAIILLGLAFTLLAVLGVANGFRGAW